MTAPTRVQLRRSKGWRMPENTVKVDRSTPWGNPFITGEHGTRQECVNLYRHLLAGLFCLSTGNGKEQQVSRAYIGAHYTELRGKNLACWCPLNSPCHADVLLEIANS